MVENTSSTQPPGTRPRIHENKERKKMAHEESRFQTNRKNHGDKANVNLTDSVGGSSVTKKNDIFTAAVVGSSNKCLGEETVTPQRGCILRDNTTATISFSNDSFRREDLSSLSKSKKGRQLPLYDFLDRTQSTKNRKRKQYIYSSKVKSTHLLASSVTGSQKKCNRKRRQCRTFDEKPSSRQHHVKSPLQTAQDCIIKLEAKGGGRDREWGPVSREIIRNSTHVKPPPCPICGNEDVRTVTQLYEVGWSCIDCGMMVMMMMILMTMMHLFANGFASLKGMFR